MKDAKAMYNCLRKHDLTTAQMDVLRRAARKYAEGSETSAFHDGTVYTYGIRGDLLVKLNGRGLIASVHKIDNLGMRGAIEMQANYLISSAFRIASGDPFGVTDEEQPVLRWRAVLSDLTVAKAKLSSLNETVLRITDAGRAVAAEWKEVVGAEEE
jgi:hypothetical protein